MRVIKGFVASILMHVFIFLAGYYMIIWWKNSSYSAIDIDLSSSTLMLRPSKAVNKAIQPEIINQEWYYSAVNKLAVIPVKITATAAAAEEPVVSHCPPPCPENPLDWANAGSTSRRPVWVEGLITESDYPKEARAQGVEGVVKVEIFIDAAGMVRDARVIKSSNDRFSAVVIDKLKNARFEPALDRSGRPIAVHMAIPIVFELH
jgi:TonB family protein